jgi:hypothetical protein
MRKLISFSFTALLLLVGAFFLFSRISTSAAGEPYEVQQARVASQVADYQRQTQDSAFRSAVVNVTMLLVVLLIIALVITGLLIVLKVVGHWLEVDRWRQEKERDTLHQLTPGNSPVPLPADNIIVGNSPMARIPATRYNVPMLINTGGQRLAMPSRPEFTVIQPEQLEGPDERTFEAVNDSSDSNVLEFSEILAQCKAAGEGKQASIEAFTGIKKGGSRAWKIYSDYWDSLK